MDRLFQVFEAEKMNTKRGLYHKKCFSCVACKSQLHYYGAIEGPDDEVCNFWAVYFSLRKDFFLWCISDAMRIWLGNQSLQS